MRLQSNEGKTFVIPELCARLSRTITNLREDIGLDEEIPLPNTDTATLGKVVEWLLHHQKDELPSEDEEKEYRIDDIDPWDQQFAGGPREQLFPLMMAANYLDIPPLLDLCCKMVAISLKGLSPEEIARDLGNCSIDWTEEDEQRVRRENPWLDEI